jgi:hypothetical protein
MTIRLGAWLAMGLWMTVTGCVVGKSSLGETSPGDDGDDGDDSGDEPGSESGSESGTSSLSGTSSPGSTTVEPGSESGSGDDGPVEPQHAACHAHVPTPMPPLPEIDLLPSGAPAFTAWEALTADCDALVPQIQTCVGGCPGSDQCIGNGEGVCASGDIDIWCDGEGEATGFSVGCFVCLSPEQHARGCCDVPDAFDCRTWPFVGTSGPNMICATHEDCELGLVCASPHLTPTGYGVCRCPEDIPGNVDLSGCFDYD